MDQCKNDILSDDPEIIQRGVMGISFVHNSKHLTADALPKEVYEKFTELLAKSRDRIFTFTLLQLFSSMCESAVFVHKFYKAHLYDAIFEQINIDPTVVPVILPLSILTAMFTWTCTAAQKLYEKGYLQLLMDLSMNENLKKSETKEAIKQLRIVVTSPHFPLKGGFDEIFGYFAAIMEAEHAAVFSSVAALMIFVQNNSPLELNVTCFLYRALQSISELEPEEAKIVSSVAVDISVEDPNCIDMVENGFFDICAENLPEVDKNTAVNLMKALNNIITVEENVQKLVDSKLWEVLPCALEAAVIPVKCEALRLYAALIQIYNMSPIVNEIPNITALSIEIAGLELEEDKLFSAILVANSVIRARMEQADPSLMHELEELDAKAALENVRDNPTTQQSIIEMIENLIKDVFE